MCKSISLISGKGGSGKTTLSLSIATMLSDCGIKVLLIDCDMSTNGATYFYENKLNTKRKHITSFYEILFGDKLTHISLININKNYDFMPSITQITKENTKTYTYEQDDHFDLYAELSHRYDVILFDCQAGYTDILKLILPKIDIHLVVMETDAISSAAIRSLYLKIGDIINERKIYQVFNRASDEEYNTYSKISGGTVFTNIETIKFDWKIRKAFSVSQIPDLQNTSANFGEQVFNVCNILFTNDELNNKIKKFRALLDLHTAEEKENTIRQDLKVLSSNYHQTKNRGRWNSVLLSVIGFLLSVIVLAMMTFNEIGLNSYIMILILIAALVFACSLGVSYLVDANKERKTYYRQMEVNQQMLNVAIEEKNEMQNLLNIQNVSTNISKKNTPTEKASKQSNKKKPLHRKKDK